MLTAILAAILYFSNCSRVRAPLKRLFRRRSRKTSKLRLTGLCAGNSPVALSRYLPIHAKPTASFKVRVPVVSSQRTQHLTPWGRVICVAKLKITGANPPMHWHRMTQGHPLQLLTDMSIEFFYFAICREKIVYLQRTQIHTPADTWHNENVIITSKRFDVLMTLLLRHVYAGTDHHRMTVPWQPSRHIAQKWRYYYVITSFWRNHVNDVILTL